MQNNAYFNHILQISGNLLQRNVNYLTIIIIFADGINIQAKRMNMQKTKIGENGNGKQKNGGRKAVRSEEGGGSDKC